MIEISALLEQARAALAGASQSGDVRASKHYVRSLMEAVADIGPIISRTSERHLPPDVAAFVAETAPQLRKAESGLTLWLLDVNQPTFEDSDGYREWLRERSAIEYMRDLYHGTVAESFVQNFATEDLDEEIRFKACYFGGAGRPLGTDPHHWWWDL